MIEESQGIWTQVWSRDFTCEENRLDIEREKRTVRWNKIRTLILKKFGTFSGLKVIEIGSGRGIYGVLASLEGAQVILLDNDPMALERARELFNQWDQTFEPILADIFHLPDDLIGRFDIAMSFGLAEHFRYPERLQIFELHHMLLRPGGQIVVSVPNRAFLPYRIGKFLLEKLNKWQLGLEIPFSRRELKRIARELKLQNWIIMGSGFINDLLNFWLVQRIIHLPGYLWDQLWCRISQGGKKCTPLKERFLYFPHHPESFLDDYLGYALVLAGEG